ncbi:L-fuconolactonase [Flavobacteriaceae bacterium MAR_2009_75]|nr:L-fuconolactonase [Flavobacteriaceae bacterium MAR_2009_75]
MKIDSHQHFWVYDTEKHAWIDDSMAQIRRDFLPADLKPIYETHNIDGCVAVQADQSLEETDFLINLAGANDLVKGVVGWVDLKSKKIAADLDRYSHQKILKGWRHIVQGEKDHNFLLRPDFLNGISLLKNYDYTYDILVFPHQLGAVLEFVKKFPNQKFVIDHMAKPYVKDGFFDGWAVLMKEIGKHENVFCKLSGMITEADYSTWTVEQLKPYINVVMQAFGSSRVMFGSDWPVCMVAGTYTHVLKIITDYISTFNAEEQNRIMGGNAIEFYNIKMQK